MVVEEEVEDIPQYHLLHKTQEELEVEVEVELELIIIL
jgi:hypothetical protein